MDFPTTSQIWLSFPAHVPVTHCGRTASPIRLWNHGSARKVLQSKVKVIQKLCLRLSTEMMLKSDSQSDSLSYFPETDADWTVGLAMGDPEFFWGTQRPALPCMFSRVQNNMCRFTLILVVLLKRRQSLCPKAFCGCRLPIETMLHLGENESHWRWIGSVLIKLCVSR